MAGRGGPKLKEYRTAITSVKQWQSEISFPHLSIVEIFSSSFGHCQVILPTINSIMTNTPDADKRVRWLTVNVGKLEEEQKQAEEDEQKKDEEMNANTTRRPPGQSLVVPAPSAAAPLLTIIEPQKEHKEQPPSAPDADDDETEGDNSSSSSSSSSRPALDPSIPTLPLLEAYHSYDHPRPLWLLFLAGKLQYELTSANPPKMQRLVAACLSGDKLSLDELAGMDLQTDSAEVAAEKRRKRLLKKKEEEEAKRKAKEMEEAQQARKKREIVRTVPELLFHISLSSFTSVTSDAGESSPSDRQPLLVLYWKDGDSDYYYHSQTLRTAPSASGAVLFPTAVVWKKPESAEAAAHMELKLALYESGDDEPVKGEREGFRLLGEGYINLASLLSGDGSVRIVHREVSIAPLSPTAKSPRIPQQADRLMATAHIAVKDRESEGVLTDYRFTLSVNGLAAPTAPADSAGVEPANAYTVSLYAIDDTAPVPILLSTTESSSSLPLVFSNPLTATHYSNLPRQLLFQLKAHSGSVINSAQLPLQSLVGKAGGTAKAAAVDGAGEPSGVEFVMRVDEVDEQGNVILPTAPVLSEEEKQRQAALRWLRTNFSVQGLQAALIPQQAVLALYQQEPSGAVSLLGTSPLAPPPTAVGASAAASPSSSSLCFSRPFLLPLDRVLLPTYKVVLLSSASSSSIADATVVGQHLFDLSILETGKTSTDLTLETAEGATMDGVVLHLNAAHVGRRGEMRLRLNATGLPVIPRGSEHTQCNAVAALWTVDGDQKEFVGRTERMAENSSPLFSRLLAVVAYTDMNAHIVVRLYDDSSSGGVDEEALPPDSDCIGQHAGLRLSSLLWDRSEAGLLVSTLDGAVLTDLRLTVANETPIQKDEAEAAKEEAEATAAQREVGVPDPTRAKAQPQERLHPERSDANVVHTLALTFDATRIEGVEGGATLTVHAVDGGSGQEEELGKTEGVITNGEAIFAVPVTIFSYPDADRSIRVSLQAAGQSRGEVTLALSSLSKEKGTCSSFTLNSAGQPLPSRLTVRVNAHADENRPASALSSSSSSASPSIPAISAAVLGSPTSRRASPLAVGSPSAGKPLLSTRSAKPSAAPTPRTPSAAAAATAGPTTVGSKTVSRPGSVHPTPRTIKNEEEKAAIPSSKKSTPKATPRTAPRGGISSSRREGSISKKAEAEAIDRVRPSSRSVSGKGPSSGKEDAGLDSAGSVSAPVQPSPVEAQPVASAAVEPEAAGSAGAVSEGQAGAIPTGEPEAAPPQAGDEEYADDTEPAIAAVEAAPRAVNAETEAPAAAAAESAEATEGQPGEATETAKLQRQDEAQPQTAPPVPPEPQAEAEDADYADDTQAEAAAE